MLVRDRYREPTSGKILQPTGKDPEYGVSSRESAYWAFSGRVGQELGLGGGTIGEIYHEVTGPMGLTLDDTRTLVSGAIEHGYLEYAGRR